jgi:glycosyltransferase involved in cell wall biosynthesis
MRISICIASYNGGLHIYDQVNSIIPQMSADDELIISDNFSTDNTIDIIKYNFSDPRLKIIYCESQGVASNFQNAILNSINDIICLCDQDDIWLSGRLDSIRKAHLNYDLVVVNGFINHESNICIYDSISSAPPFMSSLCKNAILGCSMSFNKNVASVTVPFPKIIPMHDWWIYLVSILFFKVTLLKKPLFIYRRHSNNVSSTLSPSPNTFITKLIFRMAMIFCLTITLPKIILFKLKRYGSL